MPTGTHKEEEKKPQEETILSNQRTRKGVAKQDRKHLDYNRHYPNHLGLRERGASLLLPTGLYHQCYGGEVPCYHKVRVAVQMASADTTPVVTENCAAPLPTLSAKAEGIIDLLGTPSPLVESRISSQPDHNNGPPSQCQ